MGLRKIRGWLLLSVSSLSLLILAPINFSHAQTNAPESSVPPFSPPPEGIVVLHDVVIGQGGDRDLHAEIAYPRAVPGISNIAHPAPLLPAVIYIHGGGWMGGSQRQSPILRLAKAGFFAASIEYRLSQEAKWPAQIEDCKLGVRWLRAHAAQYSIDPHRIGVWGASAGGHLAVCLGTMSDMKEYEGNGGYPGVSSAVQAVVDFFGPTDFVSPQIYTPNAQRLTEGLFGVPRDQNPSLWKSGSPLYYVKAGDPPMLIVQGDSDRLVPLGQSLALDAALSKAGVPHQLVVVKNAGHGFTPEPGTTINPTGSEIQADVFAFLSKYLGAP
jgi:acetyl esterase/lipase